MYAELFRIAALSKMKHTDVWTGKAKDIEN